MPDPWDPQNIPYNLGILARFSANQSDKLSVDTSSGRFLFQGKGALTTLQRSFTRGESLASDYYLNALRKLFQGSVQFVEDKISSGEVTPKDIMKAYQGLKNLCDTYSGDKRFKLQSLLKEITDKLPAEYFGADTPRNIRGEFQLYLRYSFDQNVYLEKSNQGVCLALCMDWTRRMLTANKTGYDVSKKQPQPLSLDARMHKKIGGLVKVQNVLKDQLSGEGRQALAAAAPKYAALMSVSLGEVNKTPLFKAVFEKCLYNLQHPWGNQPASGDYTYLLGFTAREGGHSMALRFDPGLKDTSAMGAFDLFDPNIGQFHFSYPGQRERFLELGERLLSLYTKEGTDFSECEIRAWHRFEAPA